MKLRFDADRRTLVWALLLFPALPLSIYVRPGLAPWLLPLGLYFGYCSGVLAHYHAHLPLFRHRRMNSWYSAWLSFFYGCPLFVWVPTHNRNHHRFVDGPGDATRTSLLAPRDTLWAALCYPTRSAIAQAPAILAYARDARAGHPARFRQIILETLTVIVGHGAALLVAVHLHGLSNGLLVYGAALGVPAGFAAWSMMFTNYLQHVACDSTSADDHSRNFSNRWLNWLVFDAGYHTVHHEHPGRHWSEYRALHAARQARIAPDLEQSTMLSFVLERYRWRARRWSAAHRVESSATALVASRDAEG
jgi:beta-carotene hydroxylase